MKRGVTAVLISLPLLALLALTLVPSWDLNAPIPIFHFNVVTFTTFVVCIKDDGIIFDSF